MNTKSGLTLYSSGVVLELYQEFSDFPFSNSVKFRNLFPEYVEKYEKEQQLFEKVVPEQKRAEHASEEVRPLLEQRGQSIGEGNKPEPQQDIKNVRRQSFPTWVLVLLVSIFGIVISLPLLQL